ncbi:MAG TPA: nicotinate phosphoribosyltransferase [Candidatus Omnitrophica bacterium]|nr:nicotinate phosphoribosyltransferase [Candidatus Omnitrophota bacterium]
MEKETFHIASSADIKNGRITDVYFERALKVLKNEDLDKSVKAEVRVVDLPFEWAVLAGIEEVLRLFDGINVNIICMEEGTIFHREEPVLTIEGKYSEFGIFETALLGLLSQASGISTKAARCKKLAGEKLLISFGARRMHPAIAPMIERVAFIGGCDGVAAVKSAELIGERPTGTMPHAFIIIVGDEERAFQLFHKYMPNSIPRIALIDTFGDEKFTSLKAASTLGKNLYGVRLDTPSSRRGDMAKIVEEVRWELDLRGFEHVKIIVSGGVDEKDIVELNRWVDGYGVGTSISNAPVINFSLDIVEVEGVPLAKKGKKSGAKRVFRCLNCFKTETLPEKQKPKRCECGGEKESLSKLLLKEGRILSDLPTPQNIRKRVLRQLGKVEIETYSVGR